MGVEGKGKPRMYNTKKNIDTVSNEPITTQINFISRFSSSTLIVNNDRKTYVAVDIVAINKSHHDSQSKIC